VIVLTSYRRGTENEVSGTLNSFDRISHRSACSPTYVFTERQCVYAEGVPGATRL
jgi:hypothetical protein